jgi:hypothetical protein
MRYTGHDAKLLAWGGSMAKDDGVVLEVEIIARLRLGENGRIVEPDLLKEAFDALDDARDRIREIGAADVRLIEGD